MNTKKELNTGYNNTPKSLTKRDNGLTFKPTKQPQQKKQKTQENNPVVATLNPASTALVNRGIEDKTGPATKDWQPGELEKEVEALRRQLEDKTKENEGMRKYMGILEEQTETERGQLLVYLSHAEKHIKELTKTNQSLLKEAQLAATQKVLDRKAKTELEKEIKSLNLLLEETINSVTEQRDSNGGEKTDEQRLLIELRKKLRQTESTLLEKRDEITSLVLRNHDFQMENMELKEEVQKQKEKEVLGFMNDLETLQNKEKLKQAEALNKKKDEEIEKLKRELQEARAMHKDLPQ